jgi:hypothetical protein
MMQRKSARFDTLEINEFPVVLGCHPRCSSGPSIELSWDRKRSMVVDLIEYKITRVAEGDGAMMNSSFQALNASRCSKRVTIVTIDDLCKSINHASET